MNFCCVKEKSARFVGNDLNYATSFSNRLPWLFKVSLLKNQTFTFTERYDDISSGNYTFAGNILTLHFTFRLTVTVVYNVLFNDGNYITLSRRDPVKDEVINFYCVIL